MYTKELTTNKKAKAFPLLVQRDGDVCFYDKQPFVDSIPGMQRNFDHLNNDPLDNRIENLVLCHADCNQKKKWDFDMQLLAHEKLKENVRNACAPQSDNERERFSNAHTDDDELTEGQMNLTINKLVRSTLEEKLPEGSSEIFSYSKMLKAVTFLVIEQTKGRGSETAVRRSLDAFCSIFAPWEDYKEGKGNRVIRRRKQSQ
jgi:hypothetical protein